MGGLDGRTGIASAMTMRLTGIGSTGERSRFGTRSGIDTPEAVQTVDMPVSTAPSPDLVAGDLMPANRALRAPVDRAGTPPPRTRDAARRGGMAVVHARCCRASSSESPTVGTNGHAGRPGKPEPARPAAGRSGERWAPPVVAATKLMIPRSRRPLVPRPGLSARLDEDYRLALVSAPAGYGKTAVLAMWAAEHRDHVAWFSCDRSDAEPTRFVSGLLEAIAARWPGVADDAFVLLERRRQRL